MAFTQDTFTDTAGVALASHVGEGGAGWTKHPSYATGSAVITDANGVRASTVATTAYYASGVPASADYDVEGDWLVKTLSAGGQWAIAGRMSPTQNTMYYVRYLQSSGEWQLAKLVANTSTTLATFAATLVADTTYTAKLQMRGTEIKFFIDGVERGSVTDSGITTAGRVGMRLVESGTPGNTIGLHLDSLTGTDPGVTPENTVAPVVTGDPVVGEELSSTTGTWSNDPTAYAYQWQRDGVNIAGADEATYTLVADDSGHTVQCVVTASNASGAGLAAASNSLDVSGEIASSDIKFFTAASAGLGGAPGIAMSSPTVVWDPVSVDEAAAGRIEYRAVYLKNTHPTASLTGTVVWVETQTTSPTTSISIGVAPQTAGNNVVAIADETTPPASVTFSAPSDSGTGLLVGTLGPGQARGIWQRWTVTGGTDPLPDDTFVLGWDGTPA